MKKLDRRFIDGELLPVNPGTVGQVLMTMGDGSHAFANLLPTTAPQSAQTLTGQTGGTFFWFGNVTLVIPKGGAVPAGTPAGTIIVELS